MDKAAAPCNPVGSDRRGKVRHLGISVCLNAGLSYHFIPPPVFAVFQFQTCHLPLKCFDYINRWILNGYKTQWATFMFLSFMSVVALCQGALEEALEAVFTFQLCKKVQKYTTNMAIAAVLLYSTWCIILKVLI